jgi:metal-dependent amidase/aminoacylase/carboxypeptidase family protein
MMLAAWQISAGAGETAVEADSLRRPSGSGNLSMDNRSDIWRGVDAIKGRFIELSDRVWGMPEVCYTEARSSAEHLAELEHQGFRITRNIAGIPTAMIGEWGEGGPVIAFLGEYDALPGLSQEAGVAEHRPVETGGHGHGCGHNLLGSAALLAATAVVELMNVGVNYMREHMPSDARIHYALLDTGGIAPNVVQAHARVRYSIRARDLPGMNELVQRVHKIAQGAALMTETKMEMHVVSAVSNVLRNTPLEQALHNIMEELGPPHFDSADKEFATKIRATLSEKDITSVYHAIGMDPTDRPLADFIVPLDAARNPLVGSTDVGDVSWVVPTVQVHAPTVAIGTPFHTWQVVAQGKMPAAHKAMVQAAKAMAQLGVKGLTDPNLIAAAKADLAKRTARTPYVCPLPDNVAPPLTMSLA